MFVIQNLATGKLFNGWAQAVSGETVPSWSDATVQLFPMLHTAREDQSMIQAVLPVEQQAKIVVRRIKLDVP